MIFFQEKSDFGWLCQGISHVFKKSCFLFKRGTLSISTKFLPRFSYFFSFSVKTRNDRTRNFINSRRNACEIWRLRKKVRKWLNLDWMFQDKMLEQCHVPSVQKLVFLWKLLFSLCFSLQNKVFRYVLFLFTKNLVWIVKGIWSNSMSNSPRIYKKTCCFLQNLQWIFMKTRKCKNIFSKLH